MNCPNNCSSNMEHQQVERLYHKNGEPIVIRDMKVYSCPECGQEVIPLSTMRAIQNIIDGTEKAIDTHKAPIYKAS